MKEEAVSTKLIVEKWKPNSGCPVRGCRVKKIASAAHFRRHWTEKHEAFLVKYNCPSCSYSAKRKWDLMKHSQTSHFCLPDVSEAISLEYSKNKQFIDPSPLSLDMIL